MHKKVIDLRSDLMAQPSEEMWKAMRSAQPGWVVDREDPQVSQLEQMAAELTGKEAALFVPTGRMAGLLAIMTCCATNPCETLMGRSILSPRTWQTRTRSFCLVVRWTRSMSRNRQKKYFVPTSKRYRKRASIGTFKNRHFC